MPDRAPTRPVGYSLPSTSPCNPPLDCITTARTPRPVHSTVRPASVATPFLLGSKCFVKGGRCGSESAHALGPLRRESLTTAGGSISSRHGFTLSPSVPTKYPPISASSSRTEDPIGSRYSPACNPSSQSPILPPARSRARFRRTLTGTASTASDADSFFIPPVRAVDEGKLVVVLDLDETLVYSRAGMIIPRPGINRLLDVLRGRCEVVAWTAGERLYAMEVLQEIDPLRCIQHCIYRHEKWWTDRPGYMKDVAALGRPLHQTIIIDNTPDCLRANTRNGLLVSDFKGQYGGCSRFDSTLFVLADVIEDVLSSPQVTIDAFHSHPELRRRCVQCDTGGFIEVLTLKQDNFVDHNPPHARRATSYQAPKELLWRQMLGM
ncbi:nuclear lim interactor-interacting factor [Trypanosoma conorhini]|uniref:Mitochondrial import inner membrane translocase subunit TIM50 n=1 Tax=Trypanosoma conorhini TaxID=83891 RepID=A0A3R7LE00_9TRYP|nr:nuclear lim interactor-interacting factor [Trypanosoma conorhini]RNF26523.1 nuclear lim interactor-interacting factor [Trypanosoma conorhini]